jgi:hypothetical protein
MSNDDSSGCQARQPKRPTTFVQKADDCLFEFVDVKQEILREDEERTAVAHTRRFSESAAAEEERCDLCRVSFHTKDELKIHIMGCADATAGLVVSPVTDCVFKEEVSDESPLPRRHDESDDRAPSGAVFLGQPMGKTKPSCADKQNKVGGGDQNKTTDARSLYPQARGSGKMRPMKDPGQFVIGSDQLDERYSEPTRRFIEIMELSIYTEESSEPLSGHEEETEGMGECNNCERKFNCARQYARHLHAHTFLKVMPEDQPTLCSMCGREYRQSPYR